MHEHVALGDIRRVRAPSSALGCSRACLRTDAPLVASSSVSQTRPRFALDVPQRGDAALVARVCRRAEELGYAGLWAMDNAMPSQPQLAPVPLLSFVAGHTERIRLGIAVFVLPRYNPAQIARELAVLDVLCGGRLDAGVGLDIRSRHSPASAFPPIGNSVDSRRGSE